MQAEQRQVLLLALLDTMAERGSWCGETHLQKSTFFLQEGLGVPLNFSFILYRHGPFSFELRDELAEMHTRLLLDVERRDPYGPSLKVSSSGETYKAHFSRTTQRFEESVGFIAERLANKGVAELERLGTALYVLREEPGRSHDTNVKRLTELKPHVREDLAARAVTEVEELLEAAKNRGAIVSV